MIVMFGTERSHHTPLLAECPIGGATRSGLFANRLGKAA
jgi:hypothetical protein